MKNQNLSKLSKRTTVSLKNPKIANIVVDITNSTSNIIKKDLLTKIVKDLIEKKLSETAPVTKEAAILMDSNFVDFAFEADDLFNEFIEPSINILNNVSEDFTDNELHSNEFALFPQLQDIPLDTDVPDLSDLPLEDFLNLDTFITDMENNISDEVQSDFIPVSTIIMDDFDYSSQNSPAEVDQETQAEYKELLDSIYTSDFCDNVRRKSEHVTTNAVEEDLNDNQRLFSESTVFSDDASVSATSAECNDILAILNKQYGMCQSSTELNNTSALKRKKDTIENEAFLVKRERLDEDFDHVVPPSPALSVTSNCSDGDKTVLHRMKNNEASRITRARRKARHVDLFEKKSELEKSNAQLRIKIEAMQNEAAMLRDMLITKLSSVKNK